jgi:hypothetical protein
MADHAPRRSEITTEITELCRQQREAIRDDTFLGSHMRGDIYAERAHRIVELLSELVGLEETYSVRRG